MLRGVLYLEKREEKRTTILFGSLAHKANDFSLSRDSCPLVSIVLPCYNNEDTLVQAFESLVHQSYPNREIIVIDDGSTDGSMSLIRELKKRNPDTRVFSQENRGAAETYNRGVKLARGDIVALTASDAKYSQEYISSSIRHFDDPTVAVVSGPTYGLEGGTFVQKCIGLQRRLWYERLVNPSFGWILRRKMFLELGGFDSSIYPQDKDLGARIEEHGYKIVFEKGSAWCHKDPSSVLELFNEAFIETAKRGRFFLRYPEQMPFSKIVAFSAVFGCALYLHNVTSVLLLIGFYAILFIISFVTLAFRSWKGSKIDADCLLGLSLIRLGVATIEFFGMMYGFARLFTGSLHLEG